MTIESLRDGLSSFRKQIMGFAALWIWFFHMWREICYNMPVLSFVEFGIKCMGFVGVDIFLLLSGMGLPHAVEGKSLGVYYYRRIKRLVFPFLLVAMIRTIWEKWTLRDFLIRVSGISMFLEEEQMFLWFVPAIAILYLFYPLFYIIRQGVRNLQGPSEYRLSYGLGFALRHRDCSPLILLE